MIAQKELEITIFCPKCHTLETVWQYEDTIVNSRKFMQRDGYIYHDCGSQVPCRLFRPRAVSKV
ncbi:hypothetical protein ACFLWV_02880 [Chloroflexota bacterium]